MKTYLSVMLMAAGLIISNPVRASDVSDDSGEYIGETDGCNGGECEVIGNDGQHIGTASNCLRGEECEVLDDSGNHIGTAESDE